MATYRRCNSCHELYQGKSCPECTRKRARANQRNAIDRNANLRIYHSRLWRRCRENVLMKYTGIDIWLLGIGIQRKCDRPQVHHIIERDEAPELAYDIDNLITVTKESHEEIHAAYLVDKQGALERIRAGKENYQRLFG